MVLKIFTFVSGKCLYVLHLTLISHTWKFTQKIWKSIFWIPIKVWIFAESFPLFESISLLATHVSLSQFNYAILLKIVLFSWNPLPKRWYIEPPCMFQEVNKIQYTNPSLLVWWLRRHALIAGGPSLILGRGTRFCLLQLKILQAASKSSHYTTRKSTRHSEGPTDHNWDPVQPKQTNVLEKGSVWKNTWVCYGPKCAPPNP